MDKALRNFFILPSYVNVSPTNIRADGFSCAAMGAARDSTVKTPKMVFIKVVLILTNKPSLQGPPRQPRLRWPRDTRDNASIAENQNPHPIFSTARDAEKAAGHCARTQQNPRQKCDACLLLRRA